MAEEENVKKIRDLDSFTEISPMTTEDHLIVSTSEGIPSTNKATIAEVVNLYLTSSANASDEQPDTVTDSEGNEVPNPLKGATTVTEMIDTDNDGEPDTNVEVVNTPITAKNIDSLIDPGSGLEVKQICQDEDANIIDCEIDGVANPDIKYKTKKLALASSSESKTITINVNNTGDEYRSGIPLNNGTLGLKLKRLRDAFAYIRNEIGSADTTVNINIENDIDEGEINHTNLTYFSDSNPEVNKCHINIKGNIDSKYTSGEEPPQIKLKSVSTDGVDNAYVPMWFNAINIKFEFIHLVFDLDDNRSVHSAVRAYRACKLTFIGCKISARGGSHAFIEAHSGAIVEISNLSDSDVNPKNLGFWAPALELDFGPRKSDATGGDKIVGDDFFCDHFFKGVTASVFTFQEYSPHIPWNSERNTVFQSRIHFASSRFNCDSFFHVESNCTVEIVGLFTITNTIAFEEADIREFLHAFAFNAFLITSGSHMSGEAVNSIPGNQLASDNSTENQDYIINQDITPTNTGLLSTYKGLDSEGAETTGNLTNYWTNLVWDNI